MLCLYPISNQYACGQCMNCRINLQRIWASRIQLEAYFHSSSIFVTLTYEDDNLCFTSSGEQNLNPDHLQKFLRKLKYHSKPITKIRYFAVGEYGTKTQRPHYHAVVFGLSVNDEDLINRSWSKGFHSIGELTHQRAAYIAQYTVKKMTKPGHHKLGDRYPEFTRTSREKLVGGIGAPAAGWLASIHKTRAGRKELYKNGDVWKSVRIAGKIWPLGQYMRKQIRKRLGIPQLARDRAIYFDRYDPKTGEIFTDPLPESYCPSQDILEINTPLRIAYETQQRKEGLADLEAKAEHRARSRKRRYQTDSV